jgi:hypothetical protein
MAWSEHNELSLVTQMGALKARIKVCRYEHPQHGVLESFYLFWGGHYVCSAQKGETLPQFKERAASCVRGFLLRQWNAIGKQFPAPTALTPEAR